MAGVPHADPEDRSDAPWVLQEARAASIVLSLRAAGNENENITSASLPES